jgi:hypothetical protein
MRQIMLISQITFAHLAVEFRNKLSAVPTCCDNAQITMADASQFLQYVTAGKAGCTGYQNGLCHVRA